MKLNNNPIEVPSDNDLVEALCYVLGDNRDRVGAIIETGTFEGTGTTRIVLNALQKVQRVIPFITMEPNKEAFQTAKNNLEKYPFINILYATSVRLDDALNFISNDEVLQKHTDYPDILIDNIDDPINYYRTEMFSCFNNNPIPPIENMLSKLIDQYRYDTPLFILDSCGGIGWMEFNIVYSEMYKFCHYLFMDDINHVKHFRSANCVKEYKNDYDVIFYNGRVMIVKYKGFNNV